MKLTECQPVFQGVGSSVGVPMNMSGIQTDNLSVQNEVKTADSTSISVVAKRRLDKGRVSLPPHYPSVAIRQTKSSSNIRVKSFAPPLIQNDVDTA